MRNAVLRDLNELANVQIITTHDYRLEHAEHEHHSIHAVHGDHLNTAVITSTVILPSDNVMGIWDALLKQCDAAFIIAPETNGQLADLVALVMANKVVHLGCELSAITIASSKFKTYHTLLKAGIRVVPTFQVVALMAQLLANKSVQNKALQWVLKPDDGAGCEGTFYFANTAQLQQHLSLNKSVTHVIQPYITGISASISMLCKNGNAYLLACNEQKISLQNGRFIYSGSVVNGLSAYHQRFAELAKKIAQAMPNLAGYVGIDVMVHGDNITVLEINPRLTTSFAGLRESLALNPSKILVELFFNASFTMPQLNMLNTKRVEITL